MIENITEAAPSTIDIEIRRINEKLGMVGVRIATISGALDRDSSREANHSYKMSDATRAEMQADLLTLIDRQVVLFAERRPYNTEFVRRDGWTRFYIVTNGNGHVHWTTACRTCYPTTEFYWLAEMSGMSHEDLVDQAGERACTVCFPNAPVAVREQATRIFTPTEIERQAARTAREVKKVEAAKKLIFTPDGQPLRDQHNMIVKTEVTAQRYYVEAAADALVWSPETGTDGPWGERPEHVPAEEWKARQQRNSDESARHAARLLEALAAKRGTSVDEQRDLLSAKVTAYIKRNYPNSAALV